MNKYQAIWLTGQPASGKTTLANMLIDNFNKNGHEKDFYNIDGDDTSGIKHYLVLNNEGQKEFFYYYEESGTRKGRSVSQSGQTSSDDNEQQIGSLDLHLTWSNDDNSFIGNSTIDYDEAKGLHTIDVTP